MKRVILIVGVLLATLPGFSQTNRGVSNSISSAERAQILLACMNHSGFENYYAANGNTAVNLVDLPTDIQLPSGATALGHLLSPATGEQVKNGTISNYFSLGKVTNDNQNVNVSLTYFYNHSNQGYKTVMVDLVLVNNGGQYQIVNSNYNGDTL